MSYRPEASTEPASEPCSGGNPIFAALLILTVVTQTELALAFILAGVLLLLAKAPPRWLKSHAPFLTLAPWFMLAPACAGRLVHPAISADILAT